jgi:tight adherence protein B
MNRRRASRETERLEGQLASSSSGIAAGLRAGLSLAQAVAYSASEAEAPLGDALSAVIQRTSMGVPLEESLQTWEASSDSADVRLVTSALRMRMGAGLPAVLDQIARTLRHRESARREVRSLTAQARLSGAILGLLPIGFFLFLSVTSRHDLALAYQSPVGLASLVSGFGLEALAFLWIRKLLRADV